MRAHGRYPGPWYGELRKRLRFERGARVRVPDLHGCQSRRPGRRGWLYRLTLPVEHYEPHKVQILFGMPIPEEPRVFVDGPASPHRYGDGALCMWYPGDPPDRRWTFDDGLVALIGHIAVHLFREWWWREYGEWLGNEAPHGALGTTRQAVRRRAA